MTEIRKPAYNEEFRLLEFKRPDGAGQLTIGETIQTAAVTCRVRGGAEAIPTMISDVAPYNSTAVRYKLIGGTAGTSYFIEVRIVTTNGQKLAETLQLLVI